MTNEERAEKLKEVDELRKSGMSAAKACVKAGIKPYDYHNWKRYSLATKQRGHTSRSEEEILALLQDYENRGKETAAEWEKRTGAPSVNIPAWKNRYQNRPRVEAAREIRPMANGTEGLKQAKIENQRLRVIVSDLMLDRQALMEALGRK